MKSFVNSYNKAFFFFGRRVQGRSKNGLREQGEKSSLKLLCWFGDGTRMSIYTRGLNLSLAAKVRVKHLGFFFFFLISLPRCGTKRQKRG